MDANKLCVSIWRGKKGESAVTKPVQQMNSRLQALAKTVKSRSLEALASGRSQIRRWPLAMVAGALVAGVMLDRWVIRR